MKKIISTVAICITGLVSAQLSFSGKANLLFPTGKPTWKEVSSTAANAYSKGGKNNVGFNVGLSAKIDLPSSLFVMPEIYFTSFKNEVNLDNHNKKLEAKNNRVDVPVLVGTNVLSKMLSVFAGPVASYNFAAKDENITSVDAANAFAEQAKNKFTVGYQLGAQAKFKNIIANARYEGAFSKDQRNFINYVAGNKTEIRYDNRPSMLILGLGYEF